MPWVHDSIYAAGGDHLPETWTEFQHQTGILAVVHLREGRPDRFSSPLPDGFLWLNVAKEDQLTDQQLWLAARFVDDALGAGARVLLHGHYGMQRTRPLYAAYRILKGKSLPATLREVEQRPWLKPYRGGAERLARFAEWIGTQGGRGSNVKGQKP